MSEKIYRDYFEDKEDFDKNHFGYKQLSIPEGVEAQPLAVPPVLKPDKETDTDVWFTLESKEGKSQILPSEKTKTWGYNAPLLGKKMVVEKGKRVHVTLKNSLPELTTYHWHGMEVPGPITDGGCHAPVYPGEEKQIEFPVILQDRTFHEHNQLDYRADYNQMGIFGDTPMINGVVRPYVDVTTQKVRLLFLGGSNRREWRLHFDDDLVMTQIAGYDSFLPHPIKMTKLLVTPGERLQVVVDFSQYHDGDVVNLYTEIFDPDHPKTYKLMDMKTLTKAFAEERGVKPEYVWMPGMDTEGYGKKAKTTDAVSGASEEAHPADASTGASEH